MKAIPLAILSAGIAVASFCGARVFHGLQQTIAASPQESAIAPAPGTSVAPAHGSSPSADATAFSIENLRAILSDKRILRRQAMLTRMCDSIPADRFASIYAEITNAGVETTELRPIFFASWRAKDLPASVAAAESLLGTKEAWLFRRALSEWAEKDWAAAKTFAAHLPADEQKTAASMFERKDPSQPQAAATPSPVAKSPREKFWSSVDVKPNMLSFRGPMEQNLRDLVLADPEVAAKEILGSPALRNYSDVLRVVYETWKGKDPAAADRFIAELSFDERRRTVAKIAEDLATKDIAMARSVAELLTEPKERAYVISSIGGKLAAKDPKVASEWIRLTAVADPTFVPMSLFAVWIKDDPTVAAKALLEHSGYQTFREMHPDDRIVSRYFDLLPFAERDPIALVQFLSGLPGKDRPESLYRLAQNWAKKDTDAALRWARALPEGPVLDDATRQFTFSAAQVNAEKASAHLASFPVGAARSAGIEGFAFATFDLDPDAVLVWTRSIHDENQRMDVLSRAWSNWRQKNARSAKDWAQNVAQLQPNEREALNKVGAF